jgi:hypothetical protein
MPTVVLSDNTTGADFAAGTGDTRIAQGANTTNFGNNAVAQIDTGPSTGLLKFSGLSNITGPVTVTAATLSYYDSSGGTKTIAFTRCRRNWVEGNGGAGSGATWDTYDGTNNWGTAGALNTATDIYASASGSINYTGTGAYNDLTCTATMISDIQDWINNGSNFGWVLTPSVSSAILNTRETTDGERPKLSVTYTAGASPVLMGQCCT